MNTFAFETFPELETERLRLRRILPDDAAAWLAVFNHADVMRYLIDFDRIETDTEEVTGIVRWADDIFVQKTGLRWAITRPPDDRMIGSCGFHLYSATHRCAEIGYELHRDYWRQGMMAEALAAVIRFGFRRLNLHRIEANVTAGNEASAGLLRRTGFTLEGTWRDKVYARGQFHDLWQFSLLRHEYEAAAAR